MALGTPPAWRAPFSGCDSISVWTHCLVRNDSGPDGVGGAVMRRVSMATRDELVAAVIERYSKGTRAEKGRILDAFVAVTGFHRKHAMRVLRAGSSERRTRSRPERCVYDKAVREALIVLWEA